MHRVGPSDHSVDVEIVEIRDLPGARDGDDAGPPWRRHAVAWVGAGVLTTLAVVVVVANVLDVRRETARLGALSDVPGVLSAIDGPVQEVWRVPGGQVLANSADAIVLIDLTGDTGLRGIDPDSGAVLWQRDIASDSRCLPVGGQVANRAMQQPTAIVCTPVLDADALAADADAPAADADAPAAVGPVRAVALDVATGREVGALDLPSAPMTVDVVDDDLVISRVGDRAAVQALRWDPGAARVVWSYRSEPGVADALRRAGWWNSVVDRGVLWLGQDQVIALAAASGQELPANDPPAFWSVGGRVTLADGGMAEWAHDATGDPTASQVFDDDGRLRFSYPGEPWLAEVSDGSEPGVLPMRHSGALDVVGLDARTGEQRWAARTMQGMYPYLQIDGVVVSTGSLRAIALDVATGVRVWEQPIARARTWPLTDGRVVLLLTRQSGELGLAALDLRTGAQRWSVPTPMEATYLDQGGAGTVLVHTLREIIAYR